MSIRALVPHFLAPMIRTDGNVLRFGGVTSVASGCSDFVDVKLYIIAAIKVSLTTVCGLT